MAKAESVALVETEANDQWYLAVDLKRDGREMEALEQFRKLELLLLRLSKSNPANSSNRSRLEKVRKEIQRLSVSLGQAAAVQPAHKIATE
jgi:hypothetical protein